MAPTSDERIEVAAKLRGPFDVCECVGHTYINGTLYGMQVCARDELALRDGMRHLADLIDPTCDIATDQVDDGEWGAHEIYECCSNCGNQNMRDRFTGKPYRFCPHCGSRVVSGDGE